MSVQVVGVYDQSFTLLFPTAKAFRATVKETATLMKHPIENGSLITDHRIIDPVEIELIMYLTGADYKDTYSQIKTAFLGVQTMIVQTFTSSYKNMLIQGLPHEETPDVADAVVIYLQLQEVQLISAQFQALKATRRAADSSKIKRGEQAPKESVLSQGATFVQNLFK